MKKVLVDVCTNLESAKQTRYSARLLGIILGAASIAVASSVPVLATSALATPAETTPIGDQNVTVNQSAIQTDAQSSEMSLVLRLRSRRVYLYQGTTLVNSYPVAVGSAETPTPQGEFTVSKMVENPVWQSPWTGEIHQPGPDSALGLRWIEFASTEAGAFGFHGTPTVESIGQAASNGCVRMHNEDVVALFAQVSLGTPVSIEP